MAVRKKIGLVKIILGALFAALTCAATMVVKIPTFTNGYINAGDCIVLMCGWLLGPVYGFLAAGIGSALSDIISGYLFYAPATFVIKGLTALIAALLYAALSGDKAPTSRRIIARVTSAVCGEAVMVLGYFAYEATILGYGLAAAAEMIGNGGQALFGIVVGTILAEIIRRTGIQSKFF